MNDINYVLPVSMSKSYENIPPDISFVTFNKNVQKPVYKCIDDIFDDGINIPTKPFRRKNRFTEGSNYERTNVNSRPYILKEKKLTDAQCKPIDCSSEKYSYQLDVNEKTDFFIVNKLSKWSSGNDANYIHSYTNDNCYENTIVCSNSDSLTDSFTDSSDFETVDIEFRSTNTCLSCCNSEIDRTIDDFSKTYTSSEYDTGNNGKKKNYKPFENIVKLRSTKLQYNHSVCFEIVTNQKRKSYPLSYSEMKENQFYHSSCTHTVKELPMKELQTVDGLFSLREAIKNGIFLTSVERWQHDLYFFKYDEEEDYFECEKKVFLH